MRKPKKAVIIILAIFFSTIGIMCITGYYVYFIHPSFTPFLEYLMNGNLYMCPAIGHADFLIDGERHRLVLYSSPEKKYVFTGPFFKSEELNYLSIYENEIYTFPFSRKCLFTQSKAFLGERSLGGLALISDDMKGWNCKYAIKNDGIRIEYTIYPSTFMKHKIIFTLPQSVFTAR